MTDQIPDSVFLLWAIYMTLMLTAIALAVSPPRMRVWVAIVAGVSALMAIMGVPL